MPAGPVVVVHSPAHALKMPVPEGMYGMPWPMPMSQPIMVHVGMAIATTAIMTTSAMATLRLLARANIESLRRQRIRTS